MRAASRKPVGSDWTREELAAGLAHHRAGWVREAAACYDRVLKAAPDHADGHHLRGLLSLGTGDTLSALAHLSRAARLLPTVAEYRASLGNAQLAVGAIAEAVACYRAALTLAPRAAAVRSKLGHALRLQGFLDDAAVELRRAVAEAPDLADAWTNFGLTLLDQGEIEAALVALQRAVYLAPASATTHVNLGSALQAAGRLAEAARSCSAAIERDPGLAGAHKNLGIVLQLHGETEAAIGAYRQASALDLGDADTLTNLGVALARTGELEQAAAVHDSAVAAAPELAAAWLNRAHTLQALGRLEEATVSLGRAIALDASPEAWTALGSVAAERGDLLGAEACHTRALTLRSDFADAHWNLALGLLGAGKLERGWDAYHWRWRASGRPADFRQYPCPQWQGEPLAGKRLLAWREQGLGDELLFLTCVPDLLSAGAALTLLVSPRLVGLVTRAFPDARVLSDDSHSRPPGPAGIEPFDYHVPLGSLPRWLRRRAGAFPPVGAFLAPAPEQLAKWRARLDALGAGPKIGVCWRSGLLTSERRRFYPPLAAWAPVWRVPGVTWVNLQYDDCDAELSEIERVHDAIVHRWPDEDLMQDLESVVGLVAVLDAVVTAPTVVASLAGATGAPTWQVDSGSDWTVFGGERSPWFPTLTVVGREPGPGGWSRALARIADGLAAAVADRETLE